MVPGGSPRGRRLRSAPPSPPRTARLHGSSRRGRLPAESSRAPNGPPNRADRATPSRRRAAAWWRLRQRPPLDRGVRSEEHTSELQSRLHLVCRLLLEKKKKKTIHDRFLNQ